jgi:hypothetical protein
VRSPIRRWYGLVAALSVGLLVAGCGGDSSAADSKEVFLQSVAAPGPDPYTASTATTGGAPTQPPPESTGAPSTPPPAQMLPTYSGSTPGLYGGTQSRASCDVERQIRFLTGDPAKTRAFAQGAEIDRRDIPSYLRGLTPVVLRADTRVTGHGYRNGSVTGYQAVLQAGTGVLVDEYGAPRVRCACGNPLKPPVAVEGTVVPKGRPWSGYHPERVIVIKPTAQVINNLVIVNSVDDNTWIERRTGTEGEEDRTPGVLPPVHPDDVFTHPPGTSPRDPSDRGDAPDPGDSTGPSDPGGADPLPPDCPTPTLTTLEPGEQPPLPESVPPGCPTPTWTQPDQPPADPPVMPPADPPIAPEPPSEEVLTPPDPDFLVPGEVPSEPDTFQG